MTGRAVSQADRRNSNKDTSREGEVVVVEEEGEEEEIREQDVKPWRVAASHPGLPVRHVVGTGRGRGGTICTGRTRA